MSRTVVKSTPRSSACVAWVCLIQCGLARRNFSAVPGFSPAITSATCAKNLFITAHSRGAVMLLALSCSKLPRSHAARLAALANQPQPAFAPRVFLNHAEFSLNQFAGSQPGGIGEIQYKTQPVLRLRLPALGPLQSLRHRLYH